MVPVGRYPHGLRPTPDGREVVVANMEGGTVGILDALAPREIEQIAVGEMPVQVAVDPRGRFAYVSLNGDDEVAKLDLRSRRVVGRVGVCEGPVQLYPTPNGRAILGACQGTAERPNDELAFVDATTMRVVDTIATAPAPTASSSSRPAATRT